MEHYERSPNGETEANLPRNRGIVSRADGWRKATVGLAIADRFAEAGAASNVPKTQAFVAVKRIGAHIGLKASDLMLLDTLGAFTQAQDWEEGRRPVVWASNAYLMEQTGFSLSALKRHSRRLAEAGVIAFKDSPNGKRWGRRDADGVIVEAYGFDLSPLAARAEEFENLFALVQIERSLSQQLRRQITVARRMIRARIDSALESSLNGSWTRYLSLFEALLDRLPRRNATSEVLKQILVMFQELLKRVENAYLKAFAVEEVVKDQRLSQRQTVKEPQNMNPMKTISDPHILTTKQLTPVISNSSENEEAAGVVPKIATLTPVERPEEDEGQTGAPKTPRGVAIDVPTLMQACPEFASWARNMGGYLKDWGDVYRVAGDLRPMIGISEHAWLSAQEQMGKQRAAAALALVFDKHTSGEVGSPGGYLRGMVVKAGAGELHLERSFFGRLNGQAA